LQAETLQFTVVLPQAQAVGEKPSWNREMRWLVPGSPAVSALPLLVLLPPDTLGRPLISVARTDCVVDLLTGKPGSPRLRSLATGEVLAGISPPPSSDSPTGVLAAPLTREGDVVMQPLLLFPERALVAEGRKERCSTLVVTVDVTRDGSPPPPQGHYDPRRFSRHVANPHHFPLWYEPYRREATLYDYVIVVRQHFQSVSTALDDFVQFKQDQGFSTLLVTMEQIEDDMAEVAPDRADALRGWLKKNYKGHGFKYLLIIGSPDPEDEEAIPMKRCYPSMEFEDPTLWLDVPTDMYFADLTGDWNPDGDEYPCELEDYMELPEDWPSEPEENPEEDRLDGVDLTPELFVGRIPHFGNLPHYGDGILKRVMAYEQTAPEPWHNRALLPSPMITFPDGNYTDGSQVAEYLIDKSLSHHGLGHLVLSECEGNLVSSCPGADCLNEYTVADYWSTGYGTVFWCAHGSQQHAVRDVWYNDGNNDGLPQQSETEEPAFIYSAFHKVASGAFPPVVFQGSCLNAAPEDHGNLAQSLLRAVSIANVASTRLTMGLDDGSGSWEPSPYSPGAFTLGVYFIHAVMAEGQPLGQAFHFAQSMLGFGIQPWTLKVRLEFNLLGDPSLRLPGCDEDSDCDDQDLCSGVEYCLEGQCRAGVPLVCEEEGDAGPCAGVSCLPDAGCVLVPLADDTPCEDEIPCNGQERCAQGLCVAGPAVECPPPDKPCWEALCEVETGDCLHTPSPDGQECEVDGLAGQCSKAVCVANPSSAPDVAGDVSVPAPEVDVSQPSDLRTDEPGSGEGSSGCTTGAGAGPTPGWFLFLLLLGLVRRRRPV